MTTDARLQRLTDVSRALTYARSLDEVLDLTVECAVDLLGVERAVLMLDQGDGMLRIAAARGVDPEVIGRFRDPLDEKLIDRLVQVLNIGDRRGFLGVPLVVRGEVIGLLGVGRSTSADAEAGAGDEWLLSAIADQTAVALESARHQQAREALTGRLGEVERDREAKDQAIQVMSHDIRTPLNGIQGYVALLAGGILGPVNERQAEALQRIRSVGEHLSALLDNVLDMARLQAGRIEVKLDTVRLSDIVEEALPIVAPAADRAGIRLCSEYIGEVAVLADRGRLRQVILQLLENAVKYSYDEGSVRVEARAVTVDGKRWGQVAVVDFGPGISVERRARVFEPYQRRDGETDPSRTGAGLGLAIARTLAQQMGGDLGLESEVGRGSTFTVRMPLVQKKSEPGS